MNNSNAKHSVVCDECGASLGENYAQNNANITVGLQTVDDTAYKNPATDNNTAFYNKTHHFCDESCLGSFLDKRVKMKSKAKKISKASEIDLQGNLILDIPMSKKI